MSTRPIVNLASKWKIDGKEGGRSGCNRPSDPPGYTSGTSLVSHSAVEAINSTDKQQQQHLLTKRAWDVALAPLKSLPMNMFVMYMSGSSISIFPIMMVVMMAWRPAKALTTTNMTFKGIETELGSCLLHKLVFVLGNLCAVGFALYKCAAMGLLPTHSSDWLDFVQPPVQMEFSSAAQII